MTLEDGGPEDFLQWFGLPLTGGENKLSMLVTGGIFGLTGGDATGLSTFDKHFYIDRFLPFIVYLPEGDDLLVANTFSVFGKLLFGKDSEGAKLALATEGGSMRIRDYDNIVAYSGVLLRDLNFKGDLNFTFKQANPLFAVLAANDNSNLMMEAA